MGLTESPTGDLGEHNLAVVRHISKLKSFECICQSTSELQLVNVLDLKPNEQLAFWINVHNLLTLHARIKLLAVYTNSKEKEKGDLLRDVRYNISGEEFTTVDILHNVLRAQLSAPSHVKVTKFKPKDPRAAWVPAKSELKALFGVSDCTRSSPRFRVFKPETVMQELDEAATEYADAHVAWQSSKDKETTVKVILPILFKWYEKDFGDQPSQFISSLLAPERKAKLRELKVTGVRYDPYDWSFHYSTEPLPRSNGSAADMPLMHAAGDAPGRVNKSPRSVSPHPLSPVSADSAKRNSPMPGRPDENGRGNASPRRKEADAPLSGNPAALLPVPKPAAADAVPPNASPQKRAPAATAPPEVAPAPAAAPSAANTSPHKVVQVNEAARDSPKRSKKDKKDRDEGSRSKRDKERSQTTDSPLRKNP